MISGYEGQKEVNLAMQRGEVHGACGLFVSSIKAQWLPDVKAGRLKLFVQMGPKTTDEFGKVADVFDFVNTDEDRKVLELHFKQTILGRPLRGVAQPAEGSARRAAQGLPGHHEGQGFPRRRREGEPRYRHRDAGTGRSSCWCSSPTIRRT